MVPIEGLFCGDCTGSWLMDYAPSTPKVKSQCALRLGQVPHGSLAKGCTPGTMDWATGTRSPKSRCCQGWFFHRLWRLAVCPSPLWGHGWLCPCSHRSARVSQDPLCVTTWLYYLRSCLIHLFNLITSNDPLFKEGHILRLRENAHLIMH